MGMSIRGGFWVFDIVGRKIFRPGGNCDFKLLFHVERLVMYLN